MLGRLKDMTMNRDGSQNVTVTVNSDFREEFDRLNGAEVEVTIKKASKRRSRDANAFCWALCKDIADRMHLTKEEVYRRAIREVGECEPLPIKNERVEAFREIWGKNGTGWFIEVTDRSKTPGYTLVLAYYGSSTYDTATMSRLIDNLLQDAASLGIPIPIGEEERKRLLSAWGA